MIRDRSNWQPGEGAKMDKREDINTDAVPGPSR